MNFLFPAAWGFLALAVPVIIFYLIKTRLQRRVTSTSLFWRQVSPQIYNTSIWRKLRRLLSLLLQLLLLTGLIFALSQPMASWQSLQPSFVAVVLDPSASMEATDANPNRWEEAVGILRQRIRQMRASDRMTLVLAEESPRVLCPWTGSKRTLLQALEQAKLAGGDTDIRPALGLARNLVESQARGRIVLISDGVWREAPDKALMAEVEYVPVGGKESNVGITLFVPRRAFTGPGEFQLAIRVEAKITAPVAGDLEIYRDGRLMDVQNLKLEPGKPWEHTWDGRTEKTTRFEAKLVGFPKDCLARDDHAEAVIGAQSPIRVEVVAPPNGFLDAAFTALTSVEWKRTWPADQIGVAKPDTLYVFYRSVPPKDFSARACLLIDPQESGFWGVMKGAIEQPLISDFQRESPLLRHVGLDQLNLQAAREFTPPAGSDILAESFGKPLVFGKWTGDRRWIALPFDLENTDFVLRTAFPIMLGNIVESLRSEVEVTPAAPLPGPTESILAAIEKPVVSGEISAKAAPVSWWNSHPLWWWLVIVTALLLLFEWWAYSRRITE